MQRIKILDSCRGLAAILVVFHHIFSRFSHLYKPEHDNLLFSSLSFISDLNREAVLFFFVLSGFSIRLSLYNGMPTTRSLLNDYLFRRFNRIIPLYLLAIFVTIITGVIIREMNSPDFSLTNLIGNLVFLQISKSYKDYWFSPYGGNGPLWSISFEMFFYLFFPVFILGMKKLFKDTFSKSRTKIFVLLIAFLFSIISIVVNKALFFPLVAYSTLFYVWYSGFYLGDLFIENKVKFNGHFILLIIIAILSFLFQRYAGSASLQMLFIGSSISLLFYLVMYIGVRLPQKSVFPIENFFNFLFFKAGKGSYALYLLNYPLILILLKYNVESFWIISLSMILLTILCVFVEGFFKRKRVPIFIFYPR